MNLSRIMQILADNYQIGITISSLIVVASYIVYSVKTVRLCRSENLNVAISGMLPVIQIFCMLRGKAARRKRIKNERVIDVNEEVKLSF